MNRGHAAVDRSLRDLAQALVIAFGPPLHGIDEGDAIGAEIEGRDGAAIRGPYQSGQPPGGDIELIVAIGVVVQSFDGDFGGIARRNLVRQGFGAH